MKGLRRIPCLGLVIALLGLGPWAPVSASGGPILKQRAESELEVDLGVIVDDFTPILAELAATEDENAPEKIRALLGLLGLDALDRLKVRSTLDDERAVASMTVTLDPSSDGGLLSDAFSVHTGRFEFGRYLREDEPALVVFTAGIGERIGTIEKLFARPEMRELVPMAPTDPLSLTQMWGVDMRKDILPFLSGELDMLMFPCREEQACESPNVAIVLGLTDGPAFRETLLDILTKIMGEEQGTELRTTEGEKAGSFTFYPAWPGLSYAIAPDFGIVTTDPEGLKELVGRRGRSDFPAVEATSYVRINGDLLVTMLSGLAEKAGDESPEAAIIAEVLRTVGEEPIGTLEMTARTGNGKLEMELRVPGSLYATEYRLLKEFLLAAPRFQAIRAPEDELQAVLGEVDEALTRYGQEHAGTFPGSLEELVETGYLGTLPDLAPTPLGVYVDGGYTYVPLRDETGTVVGHYFFVYGVDENAGQDVFTPENVAHPESFRVARDGESDGVVGFSFDGVARKHVESWNDD